MGNVSRIHEAKTPPQLVAIDAEREVLGCVLSTPDVERQREILGLVRAHEWGSGKHADIARAMAQVAERGESVDVVLVLEQMRADGSYERWSGPRAMGEILDRSGTVGQAEPYADIVRAKAKARALVALGQRLQVIAHESDGDLDTMRQALREASQLVDAEPDTDDLGSWTASAYEGEPEPVDWLVPDMLARGEAHILAAPGDSGKGMLVLNMALQLASGLYLTGRRAPFGRAIRPSAEPCTVVILSAEDNHAALHRRMSGLDPTGEMRRRAGDRLVCVPLPNAGGQFDIIERDGGSFRPGTRWLRLVDRLARLPNLGLVAIDPLSPFVSLDIDADSVAASKVVGETSRVAAQLHAALVVCHHMRKLATVQPGPKPKALDDLPTAAKVRSEIRGVAALLDGVRMGYGIVPLPGRYAKAVLSHIGERGDIDEGRVFWGCTVKANGRVDRRPRLYVRAEYGLLEDRTSDVCVSGPLNDALRSMV